MTNPWILSLWVGVGGFAGSIARYGLTLASQRFAVGWPLGTLLANFLSCLIIGMLAGLIDRGAMVSPVVRLAIATGFCGGFSTLAALVYETADMMRASEYLHAAIYVVGTFLLTMTAFLIGALAIRMCMKLAGG